MVNWDSMMVDKILIGLWTLCYAGLGLSLTAMNCSFSFFCLFPFVRRVCGMFESEVFWFQYCEHQLYGTKEYAIPSPLSMQGLWLALGLLHLSMKEANVIRFEVWLIQLWSVFGSYLIACSLSWSSIFVNQRIVHPWTLSLVSRKVAWEI